MRHSESIGAVSAALIAAQGDIRAVEKSATNPHFKSKYMPLDSIISMARPVLRSHGLTVAQSAALNTDGKGLDVETMLLHSSGEWLANLVYVPLAKMDPQGSGAAVTYGRRFSLSALLLISSEEDDDGNAATPRATKSAQRSAPVKAADLPIRPPVTAAASEAKSDEDKKWQKRTLGERTDDELRQIIEAVKDNGLLVELRDSCRRILARRHPDAQMDKVFAEEHAFQDTLPIPK